MEKLEHISSYAEKVNSGFDKEDIHDLRVSVKSLRSLLRLLGTITQTKPKITGKIKQLYHIAGEIREAQLELDTIAEKQYTLPAYAGKLQETIANRQNEWTALYSKTIFEHFSEKLESNNYDQLNVKALADFFNLKFATVSKLAAINDPSHDNLHQLRKEVKDVLHTAKTADQQWHASHRVLQRIPVQKLDNLADAIGDFHDNVVMQEHLIAYSILLVSGDEKTLIQRIKEDRSKQLEQKKTAITVMLKGFTTPLSC